MGGEHARRAIDFSGRRWWVKRASEPVGPGPNRFDDGVRTVSVRADGALVLRVRRALGKWVCAEVIGEAPTGAFEWAPRRVTFRAAGTEPWVVEGTAVPTPGGAHPRINLRLYKGVEPDDRREVSVTIERFRFTPAA